MGLLNALKQHFAESKIEHVIKAVEASPEWHTFLAALPAVETKLAAVLGEEYPVFKAALDAVVAVAEHELGK